MRGYGHAQGIEGLAALAQDVLRQKPTGGAVFAFRGRRGDRLKLLYFDGQGFCGDVMGRDRLAASKLGRTTGTCRLIYISLNFIVFIAIRPDF
ncbi:IS66 family insertion sequence element accessory protein TnpB [Sinorhizobium medicae]|uniref:IS66 family insertion sequence element accessory protein TnpB n=1 Tax=Sinorhizobium medicae TaxID=110321 RepID=UPI002D77C207|nr:IS66 family insertion sequence element accessory protein TnpB [Sinorhizobium medicae]